MTQNSYCATISPISDGTPRPLWSVMIPNYNSANYLRQTLESVLEQDLGSDMMQIEVIDDCSTKDDPKMVVEKLGGGRVSFYQQPHNVGKSKNYETCLKRARGHLIHILHGDDCILHGFYNKMQKAFEKNSEIGAAFSCSVIMDEKGCWQSISPLLQTESGVLNNWLKQIVTGNRLTTPSIVVKREVYEKLGGFDERLLFTEDWEMWVRIAVHYPVYYETEPLAVYRYKPLEDLAPERVRQIMQDLRLASVIMKSYLPNHLPSNVVNKLLNQASAGYALWPIKAINKELAQGNISTGLELFKEVVKCNQSLNSLKTTAKVIFLVLKHQLISRANLQTLA
ncbi:MAG: glycosyltransferase [Calothrix sp. C42_A2020_038]|nr:glycosyltransferase [Calothrix sp. C42_A2020_038]